MFCPNCGQEQFCPCDNCKPRHGREDTWVYVAEDIQRCCKCGLTAHVDWWEELEMSVDHQFYLSKQVAAQTGAGGDATAITQSPTA